MNKRQRKKALKKRACAFRAAWEEWAKNPTHDFYNGVTGAMLIEGRECQVIELPIIKTGLIAFTKP